MPPCPQPELVFVAVVPCGEVNNLLFFKRGLLLVGYLWLLVGDVG